MEESQRILEILRNIVIGTPALEHEIDIFDLESKNIWRNLKAKGEPGILNSAGTEGDFEFGGTATTVLQFVALLWGTFKMLVEMRAKISAYKQAQTEFRQRVAEEWISNLTQAGLSHEVAQTIVKEHGVKAAEAVLQFQNH